MDVGIGINGSIPAHAGEPDRKAAGFARPGVYPRPRGGTGVDWLRRAYGRGLSPPTRGNLKSGL